MASSSVMISANEARQNPIRETVIHDEARGIETAILNSVRNGLYQATVTSGTPMTSSGLTNIAVQSIDLETNQIYIPNHPFKTGDLVTVYSDETLPSPLISTEYYSVIYIDQNYIKLAASTVDAFNFKPLAIDFSVGVIDISLTNPGAGYLATPQVKIGSSTTGSTATAIANLATYGSISSVALQTNGSGYTDVPIIAFGPEGSGAVVNVVQFSAVSVSLATAGINYRVGDVISVVGGTGTSTTVTVTSITMTGGVATVDLGRPGLYTVLPNLSNVSTTVIPGGGSGCTLNLVMGIGRIAIDTNLPGGTGGTGYVSPPVVTISGGNGNGAVAEAVISAGKVIRFDMIHLGSNYTATPFVTLSTGSGAYATAILQPTGVGTVEVTYDGSGTYSTMPDITIESVGQGAEAGIVTMKIINATMTSSGSGYLIGEVLLVSGGAGTDNASILVTRVGSLGEIISFSVVTSGSYSTLPPLSNNLVIGGSGKSASFSLTAGVNTIIATLPGIGYTIPPLVTITPTNGHGSGAKAKAILNLDEVSDIEVIDSGSGYTAVPVVLITSGSGATAVAVLTSTGISQINVINSGTGYSAGITSLEILGGSGLEYSLNLGAGGTIDSVDIINPGTGFTSVPTVTVIGDGEGAILEAIVQPTSINSVVVTNSGENYTCPPTVTIEGSATAISTLLPTSISRIDVTVGGTNWTSVPTVYTIPTQSQIGTPLAPVAIANIGYSIKNIAVTFAGSGYDTAPAVTITPPGYNGTPATAISYIGAGTGTMVLSGYADSRDYYKVWKNQTPSNDLLTRPYQERMDSVIAYFTSMGYTINRQTNPNTGNTIQWQVMW